MEKNGGIHLKNKQYTIRKRNCKQTTENRRKTGGNRRKQSEKLRLTVGKGE